MKLINLWHASRRPTLSFELYPPRSEKAAGKLDGVIEELCGLKPDFVSVTFGAGGSTREGSFQLVNRLKNDQHVEVLAYFAGYGLGPSEIKQVLDNYQSAGVENILVVRGDQPEDQSFVPHPASFAHASDLLEHLRPKYDFCMGAAGYPEGHIEAPSIETDMKFLKLKVDNGAEFIVSNYFYDNRYFSDFLDRCREKGITVPVVPGIMPIYSVKMLEILTNLCGATITQDVREGMVNIPEDDKEALNQFGIEFALRQCRELLKTGVSGLHFYTMDRSQSVVPIVNQLRKEKLI